MAEVIRCTCGNVLGEHDGNLWTFRLKGRVIECEGVRRIRCGSCGRDYTARLAPETFQAPLAAAG